MASAGYRRGDAVKVRGTQTDMFNNERIEWCVVRTERDGRAATFFDTHPPRFFFCSCATAQRSKSRTHDFDNEDRLHGTVTGVLPGGGPGSSSSSAPLLRVRTVHDGKTRAVRPGGGRVARLVPSPADDGSHYPPTFDVGDLVDARWEDGEGGRLYRGRVAVVHCESVDVMYYLTDDVSVVPSRHRETYSRNISPRSQQHFPGMGRTNTHIMAIGHGQGQAVGAHDRPEDTADRAGVGEQVRPPPSN